jgi:hypothetical protein
MEVREVLDSIDERKVQAQKKYLIPSAWTLCPEMNPLQNICSSELVLILWHVHTLTQTKIENSEPIYWVGQCPA